MFNIYINCVSDKCFIYIFASLRHIASLPDLAAVCSVVVVSLLRRLRRAAAAHADAGDTTCLLHAHRLLFPPNGGSEAKLNVYG